MRGWETETVAVAAAVTSDTVCLLHAHDQLTQTLSMTASPRFTVQDHSKKEVRDVKKSGRK